MRRIIGSLALATGLLFSGNGCALFVVGGAAAAGAGGYAYVSGELKSTEGVPFEGGVTAAEAGLKDQGYVITETERESDKTKFVARGAGDEKATVTIRKVSGTATEFGVRIGTFGDKTKSSMIMDKIKTHLPK